MLTFTMDEVLEVYGLDETSDVQDLVNDFKQLTRALLGESVEVI